MKPLVILGSARPDGETRRAVDIAFPGGSVDLAVLAHRPIGGYDYAHRNDGDDFQPAVDAMLRTDRIVFATPVYWYAMSAPLKFFFDRFTDLIETAKEKGRAMTGRQVWLLATGVDEALPRGFEVPFARTADYFNMRWRCAAYLYTGENAALRKKSRAALAQFGGEIVSAQTRRTRRLAETS